MAQPIKIDLHTHSSASPDGSITPDNYKKLLSSGLLDCIAITDHDQIDLALQLHKELGDKIIVGQEITTQQGEIVGLFLTQLVTPGQNALATAKAITQQGGLVYIPHPFETVRKGLDTETLDSLSKHVDIVETHNGRAVFQNRGPQAATWARLHNKPGCASSDAHGIKGLGYTFTEVSAMPTVQSLVTLLETGHIITKTPPLSTLLYPKYNRIRGRLSRNKH